MNAKYETDGVAILKDGHTMFVEDVVKDLNRKSYLERLANQLQRFIPMDGCDGCPLDGDCADGLGDEYCTSRIVNYCKDEAEHE